MLDSDLDNSIPLPADTAIPVVVGGHTERPSTTRESSGDMVGERETDTSFSSSTTRTTPSGVGSLITKPATSSSVLGGGAECSGLADSSAKKLGELRDDEGSCDGSARSSTSTTASVVVQLSARGPVEQRIPFTPASWDADAPPSENGEDAVSIWVVEDQRNQYYRRLFFLEAEEISEDLHAMENTFLHLDNLNLTNPSNIGTPQRYPAKITETLEELMN
ncbi:hypothetical protein B0T16DRAFT_45244 [Cercophora newfieldiana]|uniref:Uncharacterized protein n=1 Tax=Cercophora newfieldiana TaxID=92897 RepID=A0AA39YRI0_9PEZI|nr:hypothetical protein B0T16DRAFT_45244 [Cercophora newfieldiana]